MRQPNDLSSHQSSADVIKRFVVSTLLESENPKQTFSIEMVWLRSQDCFVMVFGLIQPT